MLKSKIQKLIALWKACGVAESDQKFYAAALDQIMQINPNTKWTGQIAVSPEFAERMRQLCETAFGFAAAFRQSCVDAITINASRVPVPSEADRKEGELQVGDEFVMVRKISKPAFDAVTDGLKQVLKPEADSKASDQVRAAVMEAQADARLFSADYSNFAVFLVDGEGHILDSIAEEYRQHLHIPRMKAIHQYMKSVLQCLTDLAEGNKSSYQARGVTKGQGVGSLMGCLKKCIALPDQPISVPENSPPEVYDLMRAFKAQCEAAEKLLIQELERTYAGVAKSEAMRTQVPKQLCKQMRADLAAMINHCLQFGPQTPGAPLYFVLKSIVAQTSARNNQLLEDNLSADHFNQKVRPQFSQAPSSIVQLASKGIQRGFALQRNLEQIGMLFEVLVAVNAAAKSAAPTP